MARAGCNLRRFVPLLFAVFLSLAAPASADPPRLCRNAATYWQAQYKLPRFLLEAISLTETGRTDPESGLKQQWPWTVYAEARGRYLADKAAAIAEVAGLKRRGVRNIDVGCMQVNLMHHPKAFASLDEALDPFANVGYAARLLRTLHDKHRSWSVAISHYHSSTKSYNRPYRQKVMKLWSEARRQAFEEAAALSRARHEARREKRRLEAEKKKKSTR